MTLKKHIINKKNPQHKQIWEWQDSPALQQAVDQLHKSSEVAKSIKVPTLHVGTNNFAIPRKRVVK